MSDGKSSLIISDIGSPPLEVLLNALWVHRPSSLRIRHFVNFSLPVFQGEYLATRHSHLPTKTLMINSDNSSAYLENQNTLKSSKLPSHVKAHCWFTLLLQPSPGSFPLPGKTFVRGEQDESLCSFHCCLGSDSEQWLCKDGKFDTSVLEWWITDVLVGRKMSPWGWMSVAADQTETESTSNEKQKGFARRRLVSSAG